MFCRKKVTANNKNSSTVENQDSKQFERKRPQRSCTPSQVAVEAAQDNPTDTSALDEYKL